MMSLRLVTHVFGQLARPKRLLGLTALAAVPGLVAWIAGGGESTADKLDIYDIVVATVSGATLSIAVLVLGAAAMRDERDAGTLPFLYMSPIPRWRFATATWIAASGVSVLVAVGGWLVGSIGLGLGSGDWGHAWAALPAYLAAAMGYSAVFIPVGYLFNRAILVGLAYVFIWEGILTTLVSGIAASSVWRTALSMFADLRELPRDAMDALGPVLPGIGGALAKLIGVVVVSLAVFTWALRSRDAL
jgi:ABC-2 type transport system permease protein